LLYGSHIHSNEKADGLVGWKHAQVHRETFICWPDIPLLVVFHLSVQSSQSSLNILNSIFITQQLENVFYF